MENQKFSVGIDIGGTNIKIGGRVGEILIKDDTSRIVAPTSGGLLANIEYALAKFMSENHLSYANAEAVGVCCPGPLDPNSGVVINPPNLPLRNFNLKKYFAEQFPNSFVEILNDADAAAVGEYSALKKELLSDCKIRNMVLLTLGTGVGGGLILDGKLYRGKGQGGELGHMTISYESGTPWSRKCKCGRIGCLETYLNESGIIKTYREFYDFWKLDLDFELILDIEVIKKMLESATLKERKRKKQNGQEQTALTTIKMTAKQLAVGLGNLVNAFNPDAVVLGGGITDALGKYLLPLIKIALEKEAFASLLKDVSIFPANLGNSAGWQGAMLHADERRRVKQGGAT